MPDAYTYPAKPTSSVYSYSNFQGKETFDDADVIYDDADVFYDGVDNAAYTNISKPTSSVYSYVSKPIT